MSSMEEDPPLYIAPSNVEIMPLLQVHLIRGVADIVRAYTIPYFDAQFLQKSLAFFDGYGVCKARVQHIVEHMGKEDNPWWEECDFFIGRGIDIKNADALYEHIRTHALSTDSDRVTLCVRDFMYRPDRRREPTRPDLGEQLHSCEELGDCKTITVPAILTMFVAWDSTLCKQDYIAEGKDLINVCYEKDTLGGRFVVTIEVDIGEIVHPF